MATKKRRYDDGGKVTTSSASASAAPAKKKKSGFGLMGLIPMAIEKEGVAGLSPAAMVQKYGPEILSPAAMVMRRKRRRGEPIPPPGAAPAPQAPPPQRIIYPTMDDGRAGPSPEAGASGGMKRGGKVKPKPKPKPKAYAKGGRVSSRGDGIARKGKTKGTVHLMAKSPAWQRKEGKSEKGGLNAKGRASYNRANPGKPGLKAPQPEGGPRRDSFCARMSGMKKKLTSKKTANDPNSRINKSLRAWKC